MHPLNLPDAYKLVNGVLFGILFGIVLYKSGLAEPAAVRSAMRLRNGRVLKCVLLALGLGTLLFFFCRKIGMTEIQVRPGYLWGSIFGGAFAGIGLVLCGVSSVTAVAALGAGRIFALWAVAGMILAIPAVSWITEFLSRTVYSFQKMSSPSAPSDFLDWGNPALYGIFGMGGLLLLVHFTVGDRES